METNPVIEMKTISKRFGGVHALEKVDFTLGKDEVVGLIGDNGAGKSTLIKILAGVHRPDDGEIFFEGRRVEIHNPKEAKSLGIETVYQELALVDNLDIPANIFLGREPTFRIPWLGIIDGQEMERHARQILEGLKIKIDSMHSPVLNLSGGQRQAVAISRALYSNPRVVIMDEPTAALAVKEVDKVLDLVLQLKKSGVSVIFISHTLQNIFSVSDRIVILRKGRKVGDIATDKTTADEVVKLMVGAEEASASVV